MLVSELDKAMLVLELASTCVYMVVVVSHFLGACMTELYISLSKNLSRDLWGICQ